MILKKRTPNGLDSSSNPLGVLRTSHNEIKQVNSKPVSIQLRITFLNCSSGSSTIGINITISRIALLFIKIEMTQAKYTYFRASYNFLFYYRRAYLQKKLQMQWFFKGCQFCSLETPTFSTASSLKAPILYAGTAHTPDFSKASLLGLVQLAAISSQLE